MMKGAYFVGSEGSRFVKVGYAATFPDRFRDLQCATPFRLICHGHLPGSPRVERLLHRYLAEHRGVGEWFDEGPALAALEEFRCIPAGELEGVIAQRCAEVDGALIARAAEKREAVVSAVRGAIVRAADLYGRDATSAAMGTYSDGFRDHMRRNSLPAFHRVWNLLLLDEDILDNVFAVYGKKLVDRDPGPVNWDELIEALQWLNLAVQYCRVTRTEADLEGPEMRELLGRVMQLCARAA